MAESLFTSQTPAITDASDSTAYTLGTKFRSSAAGSITHGRWYFPATPPSGPVDFVLYDEVTETELARATFAGSGPGWRTVALPAPVAYPTPLVELVAAVETPDRYVATGNFFSSGGVTSGSLTAPGDGDNGRLGVGEVYPSSSFSDGCYFVDVVFEPAGGGVGAADAGLALTLAASGRRDATGSTGLGLGLSATASGGRRSAGVAGAALAFTVDAHGARPCRGTAAVGLVYAADAQALPDGQTGQGPRITASTPVGRFTETTPRGWL